MLDFWQPSGDWDGDMQGDATAFAPGLLFSLAADRSDAELAARATATVNHEVSLFDPEKLSMEATVGFPALVAGYRRTQDPIWELYMRLGATAGHALVSEDPGHFTPYLFDEATVLGTTAYMGLLVFEALDEHIFLDQALSLIAKANSEYFDEDQQMYRWSSLIDWPQATMIMTLARAPDGVTLRLDPSVRSGGICCAPY